MGPYQILCVYVMTVSLLVLVRLPAVKTYNFLTHFSARESLFFQSIAFSSFDMAISTKCYCILLWCIQLLSLKCLLFSEGKWRTAYMEEIGVEGTGRNGEKCD